MSFHHRQAVRVAAAFFGISVFGVSVVTASPLRAESMVVAQTDPIKGSDVMGDKNRSGPDGWVQAPVTRDQAPAIDKKAAGEPKAPVVTAKPVAAKALPAGEDPGTPVPNPSTGPGQQNAGGK